MIKSPLYEFLQCNAYRRAMITESVGLSDPKPVILPAQE